MYLPWKWHSGTGMVIPDRPGWGGDKEAALGWPGLQEPEGSDSIDWCQIICSLCRGPQGLVSIVWVRGFGFMEEDSNLEGGCLDKSPSRPGAPVVCFWLLP